MVCGDNVSILVGETTYTYDSSGRRTGAAGRIAGGQSVGDAVGIRVAFNRMGKLESFSFLNDSGKLTAGPLRWSILRVTYQPHLSGTIRRAACYDDRDELIAGPDGIAVREKRYNESNQLTEERYFDANELPVSGPLAGIARVKIGYDSGGRISAVAFFDRQARACTPDAFRLQPGMGDVTRLKIRYDEHGNATLECLDRRGRPVKTAPIPRNSPLLSSFR